MKCWNLSNNLASWNYLVIDKSMEKCHLSNNYNIQEWKSPYCTNRPAVLKHRGFLLGWISFITELFYRLVLQVFGKKSGCPLFCVSVPLFSFLTTLYVSMARACGLWVTMKFSSQPICIFCYSIYAHPTVQLHLPIPTIWPVSSELKNWLFFSLFLFPSA